MVSFDLSKYQTLRDLYGEHEETFDLLHYGKPRHLKFSIRKWCDNLDNIIENE